MINDNNEGSMSYTEAASIEPEKAVLHNMQQIFGKPSIEGAMSEQKPESLSSMIMKEDGMNGSNPIENLLYFKRRADQEYSDQCLKVSRQSDYIRVLKDENLELRDRSYERDLFENEFELARKRIEELESAYNKLGVKFDKELERWQERDCKERDRIAELEKDLNDKAKTCADLTVMLSEKYVKINELEAENRQLRTDRDVFTMAFAEYARKKPGFVINQKLLDDFK